MYRKEEYKEERDGRECNICSGRKEGRVLCFVFYSEKSERKEFAHRECLDNLLDEENFKIFIIETRQKIKELNSRLQAREN